MRRAYGSARPGVERGTVLETGAGTRKEGATDINISVGSGSPQEIEASRVARVLVTALRDAETRVEADPSLSSSETVTELLRAQLAELLPTLIADPNLTAQLLCSMAQLVLFGVHGWAFVEGMTPDVVLTRLFHALEQLSPE